MMIYGMVQLNVKAENLGENKLKNVIEIKSTDL
jgi:hypothetical protein